MHLRFQAGDFETKASVAFKYLCTYLGIHEPRMFNNHLATTVERYDSQERMSECRKYGAASHGT